MAQSNFIDYIKLYCRSGHGGAGATHFRREKHVPLGGPDGGDGGRGGHIILRGNAQRWTLLHLRYQKHVLAQNGANGEGATRSGAQGADIVLEVPLGTLVRDAETDELRAEVTHDGQEIVVLPGGRGGLGNWHFRTATNQAPRHAQPGEPGQEGWLIFELKILADVGLVGFPNAGKSTLLSVLSAAQPKIADYPFTTLTPNLGVVAHRQEQSFVMADIPGIIEGAAEGKGLGTRFLRHIERNSVLLFMVPADSADVAADYRTLLHELEKYNPELLDKSRLLAVSKADLLDDELREALRAELPVGVPAFFISSVAQQGLTELKDALWTALQQPA